MGDVPRRDGIDEGERHMIDSRYYIMRTTAAEAGKLGNRTEKLIEMGW